MRGRAAALSGALLAAFAAGACDPCAGIVDCTGAPRLALQGRIVETATGVPVQGARITMVRYSGSSAIDSVSGLTDAHGEFLVALRTEDATGPALVDVAVRPPAGGEYRVRGLRVTADERRGEAQVLPTWVDRPFFAYAGEAWPLDAPRGERRLIVEELVFERLGGVEVTGLDPSQVAYVFTDSSGRFPLLDRTVTTQTLDTLVGRVGLIRNGFRAFSGEILKLVPTQVYQPPTEVRVVRLGLNFPYIGVVREFGLGARGVRVDFRRVGGAAGTREVFSTVSDENGYFHLREFAPTEAGPVTFDLTFTPRPPYRPFTKRVVLPVHGGPSFGERFAIFRVDLPDAPPEPFTP